MYRTVTSWRAKHQLHVVAPVLGDEGFIVVAEERRLQLRAARRAGVAAVLSHFIVCQELNRHGGSFPRRGFT